MPLVTDKCYACFGSGKVSRMQYIHSNGYSTSLARYENCMSCSGLGTKSVYKTDLQIKQEKEQSEWYYNQMIRVLSWIWNCISYNDYAEINPKNS